jgi:hypothetical protein
VITALSLIGFAYAGGITLISGAIFAGLVSAGGLIPQALLVWFGLNGNATVRSFCPGNVVGWQTRTPSTTRSSRR